jgi:hypothetical protein
VTAFGSDFGAVAADMSGGDSRRLLGDHLKKGAHGGNMVSPMRKEVLLGDAEPAAPTS